MNARGKDATIAAVMLGVSVASVFWAGCGRARNETPAAGPRIEDMSRGNIEVVFTADPPRVQLDRDVLLTLRITAPSDMEVTLPALNDRVQGFMLSGVIDEEPVTRAGKVIRERRARLTPILAREYRLAPMAIAYTDHSRSPADSGWFPTRPLLFDPVPPIQGRAGKDIDSVLAPVWIYPSAKTVGLYGLMAIVLILILFLAWKLLKRVRRAVQLMRMSPRERALHDLAELLAKGLVARNLVKEFYLELTLIVRQYIERAHAIRAPEQTTEEFLKAVSSDPRFSAAVVAKLKGFLEAADLVKFAAYRPPPDAIDGATNTARQYVEADAEAEARGQGLAPRRAGSDVRREKSETEKRQNV